MCIYIYMDYNLFGAIKNWIDIKRNEIHLGRFRTRDLKSMILERREITNHIYMYNFQRWNEEAACNLPN